MERVERRLINIEEGGRKRGRGAVPPGRRVFGSRHLEGREKDLQSE